MQRLCHHFLQIFIIDIGKSGLKHRSRVLKNTRQTQPEQGGKKYVHAYQVIRHEKITAQEFQTNEVGDILSSLCQDIGHTLQQKTHPTAPWIKIAGKYQSR